LVERHAIDDAGEAGDRNRELLASLVLDGRADGLIAAFATIEDQLVAELSERQVPLVLVNRRMPGVHGSVAVDDEAGSALATEHLIGLGHTALGYVGFEPETDTSRRREEGFRRAMKQAGLEVESRWLASAEPSKRGGTAAAAAILEADGERPTG